MYNLPYFKEKDEAVVLQFVRDHPFAFICACDKENQPAVTQIPVFIDERDGKLFLSGHMMRHTDHQLALEQHPEVVVVFTGPHCYVSASWYTNPQQGSTWNYMSVHARGRLRFLGQEALLAVLQRTTDHFESDPDSGANFKDLPAEYIERMSKAIVAFEIEVRSLENVFKLSQNRDPKSYDHIIERLETQPGTDASKIAQAMRDRRSNLFPS